MTTGSGILANDGDGSVSGTTFQLILHAHNTCGGKSACHLLVVPTVDHDSKLLSCELRTAHTDTILSTVDIVFVL